MTLADAIEHQPGQYVEILVHDRWLPCSIATPPSANGRLTLQLRHTPLIAGSEALLQVLSSGHIPLRGPHGRCLLPATTWSQPLAFLAGGTGFSPIQALLSEILRQDAAHTRTLFWGVRRPEDLYALKQIKGWQDTSEQFHFYPVLSEPMKNWTGLRGWVHERAFEQFSQTPPGKLVVSGPYPMVQKAFLAWHALGLPAQHFLSDMMSQPTS